MSRAAARGRTRPAGRVRTALRRHGLVRRPRALRRFLKRHGLRFTDGNRVRLFATGDLGLEAMLLTIEQARERIHLETYILRSDRTGHRFLAALTERARAGVAVRVIYDAFGSLAIDAQALAPLRAAGGEVAAFNPLRRFYPRWLPRRRDHRKILVVDGAVGFTGGLNIGDEYNVGPQHPPDTWRDTHVQLEGPAVRELEAVFLESWFRAGGAALPWEQLLAAPAAACGAERVAVVPDGPAYARRTMRDLVALALRTGQRELRLTSPYFVPDHKVAGALIQAARRGPRVALLLAGRTDHPVLRRAAHALLPPLLAAGVEVYEYATSMLHAKTTTVDDDWAIAGTSNLDRQSFEHSYEVNLVIEGGAVPGELATQFEADLAHARRVDFAHLRARGLLERIADRVCALVLWVI